MYKKNFIVVLKVNGQILRERDGIVNLPYNSEYIIYFKNLNSKDAQLSITVDGKDVGNKLLVRAGKTAELDGFFSGSIIKNKFKFIKKTKQIMNHRGDNISDGIITIEYTFAKKIVTERIETEYINKNVYNHNVHVYDSPHRPEWYPGSSITIINSSNLTCDFMSMEDNMRNISPEASINICQSGDSGLHVDSRLGKLTLNSNLNQPNENEGITVRGSRTNQQFQEAWIDELEESSSVITLKLCGYISENKVEICKPVTVKTKIECETCGIVSKSTAKFCKNCGTSLI